MNPSYLEYIIEIDKVANSDLVNNTNIVYNRINTIENQKLRDYFNGLIEVSESLFCHERIPKQSTKHLQNYLDGIILNEINNNINSETVNKREIIKDAFIIVKEFINQSIINDLTRMQNITESMLDYIDSRFEPINTVLPLSVFSFNKLPKEELNKLDRVTKRAVRHALPNGFISKSPPPSPKTPSKSPPKSKGGKNYSRKYKK
jgi:hypothetical protein